MDGGELEAASEELKGVLAENPDYVEARVSLGLVLYRAGRYDLASAEWRTCLDKVPDHPKARAFLNMPQMLATGGEEAG